MKRFNVLLSAMPLILAGSVAVTGTAMAAEPEETSENAIQFDEETGLWTTELEEKTDLSGAEDYENGLDIESLTVEWKDDETPETDAEILERKTNKDYCSGALNKVTTNTEDKYWSVIGEDPTVTNDESVMTYERTYNDYHQQTSYKAMCDGTVVSYWTKEYAMAKHVSDDGSEEWESSTIKKYTVYRADGTVDFVDEYDDNGCLSKATFYSQEGDVTDYHVYEYTKYSYVYTYDETTGTASMYSKTSDTEYDAEGNVVSVTKYEKKLFTYDETDSDGVTHTWHSLVTLSETETDAEGNVTSEYTYEYNDHAMCTLMVQKRWDSYYGELSEIYRSEIEYDSNDNLIKQTAYSYGKISYEFYDAVYNDDGNCLSNTTVSYSYNYPIVNMGLAYADTICTRKTSYTYNADGYITAAVINCTDELKYTDDSKAKYTWCVDLTTESIYTTTYEYGEDGYLTSEKYTDKAKYTGYPDYALIRETETEYETATIAKYTSKDYDTSLVDGNVVSYLSSEDTSLYDWCGNVTEGITIYYTSDGDIRSQDKTTNTYEYGAHEFSYEYIAVPATSTTAGVLAKYCACCYCYVYEEIPADPTMNTPVDEKFSDVADGKWYTDKIQYINDLKIMNGYNGTDKFGTNDNLKREDFAVILWNLAGKPDIEVEGIYQDENTAKYYAKAIEWCAQEGIATGMKDKDGVVRNFGVGKNITRQDLAVMIYNFATKYYGFSVEGATDLSAFPDASSVKAYATNAVQWAVGNGIINGAKVNGKLYLNPTKNATRAEVATMIYNFLTNLYYTEEVTE